jgi:hypothetical protein
VLEQVVAPQARVGHEVVEALHQVALREDRQLGQRDATTREALAPERRARGRVPNELGELLPL